MDELDTINAEISKLDQQLALAHYMINKAMGELNVEYAELLQQLPRQAPPIVKPKTEGDHKRLFRKIATKTHEDKLRQKHYTEDEIKEMAEIFVFAKSAYEDEDVETLELIENSLDTRNAKAILIAQAKTTLNKKNEELNKLVISVDYSISLDYLSGVPARIAAAKQMFVNTVTAIIAGRLAMQRG